MGMFNGCKGLTTIDLSNFDTSNAKDLGDMFYGCTGLKEVNLSSFNTEKVEDMSAMFTFCWGLKSIDLSSFNTKNVTMMYQMFAQCTNLETIYVSEDFVTDKVRNSDDMFMICECLVGGKGTKFDKEKEDKTYAKIDGGEEDPGYFSVKKP